MGVGGGVVRTILSIDPLVDVSDLFLFSFLSDLFLFSFLSAAGL